MPSVFLSPAERSDDGTDKDQSRSWIRWSNMLEFKSAVPHPYSSLKTAPGFDSSSPNLFQCTAYLSLSDAAPPGIRVAPEKIPRSARILWTRGCSRSRYDINR